MTRFHRRSFGAALITLALAAVRLDAQTPTVQQVYDRYAEAIGGRAAWAAVEHRYDRGTADITFAGIVGSYERYNSAPNKMRMVIDLGMGKVDQGFDGTRGWVEQPGQPPQLMPAEQAASAADASTTGGAFLDPSRYQSATVDGTESYDGVACWKLTITPKVGEKRTEYFEVETGLRRGVVVESPMGGQQRSTFTEYKAFDGKKVATRQVQSTMQGDVVIVLSDVSFAPIDPTTFALPASIR